MKRILFILTAAIPVLFLGLSLCGAEYVLSPGDDADAVISKLRPGDTLLVKKGFHRPFKNPITVKGTKEKPIVIRGEDPDLSVFSSWSSETNFAWEPVPGKRFVWSTPFPGPAVAAAETGHGSFLLPAPDIAAMPLYRGSFFFDAGAKRLYVHGSTGERPEANLHVSTFSGHIISIIGAEYLVLKDLSFLGSAHEVPRLSALGAAIRAQKTKHLTIEGCRFFFNYGGVNITNACEDTTVRNCFFRKNISPGYSEMAQLFFGSRSTGGKALNNLITDGQTHGLRFYSGAEECTAIGNIVVNEMNAIYFKASRPPRRVERNVSVSSAVFSFSDLQGGSPIQSANNTLEQTVHHQTADKSDLIFPKGSDQHFCAPEFYDFRLQGDSPALGKGAYPDPAPVIYLDPSGSDENKGDSQRKPLKTAAAAVKACPAGGTIYVATGSDYPEICIGKALTLRGRGKNPSVHFGKVEVTAPGVTIENCKADAVSGSGAEKLCLRRVEAGRLELTRSPGAELYRCAVSARKLDAPPAREVFSEAVPGHVIPAGPYDPEPAPPVPSVEALRAETLWPCGGTVRWETPTLGTDSWRLKEDWWQKRPVTCFLEYGETPECKNVVPSLGELWHSINLQNLKPGTRYFYRVRVPEKPYALTKEGAVVPCNVPGFATVWNKGLVSEVKTFETPEKETSAPKTVRVKPGELTAVSGTVQPGDTIVLAPGIYHETFKPAVSGHPGAPIAIRSEVPGKAVLDGRDHLMPGGVYLDGVSDITVEGLTFRNFGNKNFSNRAGMEYGQIQLVRAERISIRDCRFFCSRVYQQGISVKLSKDVTIENNLFCDGVYGVVGGNNGSITMTRNTLYHNQLHHVSLMVFRSGAKFTFRGNLMLGIIRSKAVKGNQLVDVPSSGKGAPQLDVDGNVWYFPPENRVRACGFLQGKVLPAKDGLCGLPRLQKELKLDLRGREITSFRFRNCPFFEPFNEQDDYSKRWGDKISEGWLPKPGEMDPHPALKLDGAGCRGI